MSPRTPTLPPTDGAMWRKLLARTHPDAGGTHELFIWVTAVKDVVCGGELHVEPKPEPTEHPSRRRVLELSEQGKSAAAIARITRSPHPLVEAVLTFEEGADGPAV